MNVTLADLLPLAPLGVLSLGAMLLLVYEVFAPRGDRTFAAHFTILVLAIGIYLSGSALGRGSLPLFVGVGPLLYADDFSRAASVLLMSGAIVTTLLSPVYARHAKMDSGEYYALLLMAVVGMITMVMAADLVTAFLGLETMSIAVYALTGMRANDTRASEAALKYFLVGAFASGFLLFGIALVYGATGRVDLPGLAAALDAGRPATAGLLTMGIVLVLVGFGFKISAVPFHMWAPDVYEGAPTPVTGFMAVGVKAAAFLALVRLVAMGFAPAFVPEPVWIPVLSALAVATILVGNALALVQANVKRMLAYSSIAHAGYALIGVVAAARGEASAGTAVLFYMSAYTFTTLGAFGVLTFLERKDGGSQSERFGAFAGLGFKHPAVGIAMTVFMIALAGMPPTGGFFAKLYVFSAAIRAGDVNLAVIGVVGSVIGVFYYLRVIVAFYMREHPEPGPTPSANPSIQLSVGLWLSVILTLVLGLLPNPWLRVTRGAGEALRAVTTASIPPPPAGFHRDHRGR